MKKLIVAIIAMLLINGVGVSETYVLAVDDSPVFGPSSSQYVEDSKKDYYIGNLTYKVSNNWSSESNSKGTGYRHYEAKNRDDGGFLAVMYASSPCNIQDITSIYNCYQYYFQELLGESKPVHLIMGVTDGYLTASYSNESSADGLKNLWALLDGVSIYILSYQNKTVDNIQQEKEFEDIIETISYGTVGPLFDDSDLEDMNEETDMSNIRTAYSTIVAHALLGEPILIGDTQGQITIKASTGSEGDYVYSALIKLTQERDGWQSDIDHKIGEHSLETLDVGKGKTIMLTYSLADGLSVEVF